MKFQKIDISTLAAPFSELGQFIWTECSGKIRELWDKYGGIKIPNSYLPMFMDERTLQTIEIEEGELYKYSRVINRGEADEMKVEKEIYGFPNKDVMEKYIQETDTSLEELLKRLNSDGLNEAFINEHVNYRSAPRDMWTDLRILKHFTDDFKRTNNTTLTERQMEVLTKSANNVYNGNVIGVILRVMTRKRCSILWSRLWRLQTYLLSSDHTSWVNCWNWKH